MKIYTYILLAGIFCSGCSDWFDVHPRSETREQEHYAREEGFQSVLTGVYIRMAQTPLYGREMTMSFTELLAQHWETRSGVSDKDAKRYHNIASYKYTETDVEELLSQIWKEYYLAIGNLNSLLSEIDEKEGIFSPENYELIKGEALGLRAFLHFDLLRLFGPIPGEGVSEEIAIPYVKEVTKMVDQLASVSYREVTERILKDLDEAESLLKNDPLVKYDNEDLNNPGGYGVIKLDNFHYYRQYRFNLYAVKATKARVYLWLDNKQEAGKYATEVISSQKFRLALNSDLTTVNAEDRTFTKEHIFAIHNSKLSDVITPLFRSGEYVFQRIASAVTPTFEAAMHPEDIRVITGRYWETRVTHGTNIKKNCYKKYYQDKDSDPNITQVVPLIRLSEMYLIAMECSSPDDALPYFKDFRVSRRMSVALDAGFADVTALMSRVEKEYRKEFFAEGQMFFFCKRLNRTKIMGQKGKMDITMDQDKYVIPKPSGQVVFE